MRKLPAIFEQTYLGGKPCLRVIAEDDKGVIDVHISTMRIDGTEFSVNHILGKGPEPKTYLYLTDTDMWAAYEI